MPFRRATSVDDLWSGEMTSLSIDGAPVLLLNIDGAIRAYADWCPHQRNRLSAGSLQEGVLTCATHHWQFDARTGRGVNPKDACLRPIAVSIVEGEILVDVSEGKPISGLEQDQSEK
jgi:toluene monooxygenase system ferredoxin subunit